MRRLICTVSAFFFVLGIFATPPAAAQQSVNIFLGGFVPRTFDARDSNDVLVNNLACGECFAFRIRDFDGATAGAEWLVGLGDRFEGGLGVGIYSRNVPSVYANFTNKDGSEIGQNLKLRVVPFTATVRYLPLGHHDAFEPYIGAGVGVLNWRYTEAGTFIDFSNPKRTTFGGTFAATGSATGPVILGGVRVPVGRTDVGGEIRYQAAKGTLPGDEGFAGSKIDLGGFNYLFTINIRF
jgi:hypothetical protein